LKILLSTFIDIHSKKINIFDLIHFQVEQVITFVKMKSYLSLRGLVKLNNVFHYSIVIIIGQFELPLVFISTVRKISCTFIIIYIAHEYKITSYLTTFHCYIYRVSSKSRNKKRKSNIFVIFWPNGQIFLPVIKEYSFIIFTSETLPETVLKYRNWLQPIILTFQKLWIIIYLFP
jgi:hypothetical protein